MPAVKVSYPGVKIEHTVDTVLHEWAMKNCLNLEACTLIALVMRKVMVNVVKNNAIPVWADHTVLQINVQKVTV